MTPPRRPVGRPPYDLPGSACRHAGRRGRRPLQGAPRTFRGPRPNGIPLFWFALQGGVLTPPRRPVGRPPYDLPGSACRHAGRRGRRPYKVRRAVGAGHARPAASRNRPFTVDPQGRDSSLPCRVPPPSKQKPRKAPRPARSFCILKNVTPFSRRSAFSARPESRPAVPPAWGRRGQQAPPPRAPHACPSPSACS